MMTTASKLGKSLTSGQGIVKSPGCREYPGDREIGKSQKALPMDTRENPEPSRKVKSASFLARGGIGESGSLNNNDGQGSYTGSGAVVANGSQAKGEVFSQPSTPLPGSTDSSPGSDSRAFREGIGGLVVGGGSRGNLVDSRGICRDGGGWGSASWLSGLLAGEGKGGVPLGDAAQDWLNSLKDSKENRGMVGGIPSLVGKGITQQLDEQPTRDEREKLDKKPTREDVCQNAGWLRGECEHGTVRWVKLACKKRTCLVCGKVRKHLIAWRIALGIEKLGGVDGGGWFVGTFARDISKVEAVKTQNKFIRWLRSYYGKKVEYTSTWEVTKAGRLHLNLILVPWLYIPQAILSAKWQRFGGGNRVWIERVGSGIGIEVAKDREKIGNYVAKFDQMVLTGRGVSYSKGFPKLPDSKAMGKRKGKIEWQWVGSLETDSTEFEIEKDMGYWAEVAPNEWGFRAGEDCHCFDIRGKDG